MIVEARERASNAPIQLWTFRHFREIQSDALSSQGTLLRKEERKGYSVELILREIQYFSVLNREIISKGRWYLNTFADNPTCARFLFSRN